MPEKILTFKDLYHMCEFIVLIAVEKTPSCRLVDLAPVTRGQEIIHTGLGCDGFDPTEVVGGGNVLQGDFFGLLLLSFGGLSCLLQSDYSKLQYANTL
ncbi:uncharacterized [Tachysurus ichikawai]